MVLPYEIEFHSSHNVIRKWVTVGVQVTPNHIAAIMMPANHRVGISAEWVVILVKCVVRHY
jgi:hypothetical protein